MKAVEKHIDFLCVLTKASRQQRKTLLQTISTGQLHALLEVIYNVIKGTVVVSTTNKSLLKRYKRIIRQVIAQSRSKSEKIRLLLRHSEIFGHIVKIALKQILEKRHKN